MSNVKSEIRMTKPERNPKAEVKAAQVNRASSPRPSPPEDEREKSGLQRLAVG
jgi:hypothetical protein